MKRILSILMVLCLVLGMAVPVFAADTDALPDFPVSETGEPAPETVSGLPGESVPEVPAEPEPETPESIPVEEIPSGDSAEGAVPATPTDMQESPSLGESCSTPEIKPFSGFEDEDLAFFTRIRLTVTGRDGNPIAGAVFGLYRADNDSLVEYLKTDSFGVAVSGDVPVDTDYYLLEEYTPEGYLPIEERKDIILSEVCAPSRVDVTAVYDPVTGYIQIIKVDEDGNPLPGAGFYVYSQNPWAVAADLTTGPDGTAMTGELPYGQYEIYEHSVPEGYSGSGWDYVFISGHGKTEEITIVNYKAAGYVRIHKTGEDERKIQGAVFSVYDSVTDDWVEDVTTNSSGYAYSSSLPLGDYYTVEKSVPAPYRLSDEKHGFAVSYDGQAVYLNIVNEVDGEPGKITVVKTDDSGNPLSGVVFGLYRGWDDKKLSELTTSADGTAESGALIPGGYYLVELSGKLGYEMVAGRIPFTVGGDGQTIELVVENPKIRIFGKVKVIKTDDAGAPVPGARFGVYCHAGNLLEELVTDAGGTAESGVLNEGSGYYLMELEGVPGYLEDLETKHSFSITENNAVVTVNVINPRISGTVKVVKGDGEGHLPGNPLPGVVFGIFKDGAKIEELTTSEDGTAASGLLYYGDYELRELATAEGYELIDAPIPFSITEDGVTLEIPVSNPLILGSVRIIKVDADNQPAAAAQEDTATAQSPLAGAVFGLYNARGQKITEITVGDDGTAVYGGLPQSSYYLKELAPPEGFVLLDEIIPFSIETQAQVVEVTVPNARGFGTVKVLKTGENDAPLSGVAFDIYRASTDEKIGGLVTGEDGEGSAELPLGRYYLVETAASPGYRLPEGRVSFTLTEDGATVVLPIRNQKEPAREGKIRLVKKSEDGELLSGAVFGVYEAATGEKAAELVTGKNGEAVSPALPVLESGYYLLEITPPAGYRLSTEKIPAMVANGDTVTLTVTNKAEETPAPTPKPGKLLLVKTSGSGEKLKGAVFGVYGADTDKKVTEITTDRYGEAVAELPAGDYYLRELEAPEGYKRSTDRVRFTIKSGETKEVTVTNKAEAKTGALLLIKESESGEPLRGAVFGIYDAETKKKVDEMTTDRYGEAELELDAGDFFLRELKAPAGYALLADKISFKIKAGETKELTVTNKLLEPEDPAAADTGTLHLVKKAEGSGKRLSGAVFGVYELSTEKLVAEITTDANGEAAATLPAGNFYLLEHKAPAGYALETAKIPFIIKANTAVKAEVTNMLENKAPAPAPDGSGTPGITIPKTGEAFPALHYTLAALLFGLAALCGAALWKERGNRRRAVN